jgi:hypothetical protein
MKMPDFLGSKKNVLVVSLAVGYVLLSVFAYILSIKPSDVRITNLSSQSFSLSWNSISKSKTKVIIEDLSDRSKLEYEDIRIGLESDIYKKGRFYTHYFDIVDLDPEHDYAITVLSNGMRFKIKTRNILADQFSANLIDDHITTTKDIEKINKPLVAYGSIDYPIGDVADGVLYFSVGKDGKYLPFSSSVNEFGNWELDWTYIRERGDPETLYSVDSKEVFEYQSLVDWKGASVLNEGDLAMLTPTESVEIEKSRIDFQMVTAIGLLNLLGIIGFVLLLVFGKKLGTKVSLLGLVIVISVSVFNNTRLGADPFVFDSFANCITDGNCKGYHEYSEAKAQQAEESGDYSERNTWSQRAEVYTQESDQAGLMASYNKKQALVSSGVSASDAYDLLRGKSNEEANLVVFQKKLEAAGGESAYATTESKKVGLQIIEGELDKLENNYNRLRNIYGSGCANVKVCSDALSQLNSKKQERSLQLSDINSSMGEVLEQGFELPSFDDVLNNPESEDFEANVNGYFSGLSGNLTFLMDLYDDCVNSYGKESCTAEKKKIEEMENLSKTAYNKIQDTANPFRVFSNVDNYNKNLLINQGQGMSFEVVDEINAYRGRFIRMKDYKDLDGDGYIGLLDVDDGDPNVSSQEGLKGGSCTGSLDCGSAALQCIQGTCQSVDLQNDGDVCGSNSRCGDGLVCNNGVCKSPLNVTGFSDNTVRASQAYYDMCEDATNKKILCNRVSQGAAAAYSSYEILCENRKYSNDCDGDGVINAWEILIGSDPNSRDLSKEERLARERECLAELGSSASSSSVHCSLSKSKVEKLMAVVDLDEYSNCVNPYTVLSDTQTSDCISAINEAQNVGFQFKDIIDWLPMGGVVRQFGVIAPTDDYISSLLAEDSFQTQFGFAPVYSITDLADISDNIDVVDALDSLIASGALEAGDYTAKDIANLQEMISDFPNYYGSSYISSEEDYLFLREYGDTGKYETFLSGQQEKEFLKYIDDNYEGVQDPEKYWEFFSSMQTVTQCAIGDEDYASRCSGLKLSSSDVKLAQNARTTSLGYSQSLATELAFAATDVGDVGQLAQGAFQLATFNFADNLLYKLLKSEPLEVVSKELAEDAIGALSVSERMSMLRWSLLDFRAKGGVIDDDVVRNSLKALDLDNGIKFADDVTEIWDGDKLVDHVISSVDDLSENARAIVLDEITDPRKKRMLEDALELAKNQQLSQRRVGIIVEEYLGKSDPVITQEIYDKADELFSIEYPGMKHINLSSVFQNEKISKEIAERAGKISSADVSMALNEAKYVLLEHSDELASDHTEALLEEIFLRGIPGLDNDKALLDELVVFVRGSVMDMGEERYKKIVSEAIAEGITDPIELKALLKEQGFDFLSSPIDLEDVGKQNLSFTEETFAFQFPKLFKKKPTTTIITDTDIKILNTIYEEKLQVARTYMGELGVSSELIDSVESTVRKGGISLKDLVGEAGGEYVPATGEICINAKCFLKVADKNYGQVVTHELGHSFSDSQKQLIPLVKSIDNSRKASKLSYIIGLENGRRVTMGTAFFEGMTEFTSSQLTTGLPLKNVSSFSKNYAPFVEEIKNILGLYSEETQQKILKSFWTGDLNGMQKLMVSEEYPVSYVAREMGLDNDEVLFKDIVEVFFGGHVKGIQSAVLGIEDSQEDFIIESSGLETNNDSINVGGEREFAVILSESDTYVKASMGNTGEFLFSIQPGIYTLAIAPYATEYEFIKNGTGVTIVIPVSSDYKTVETSSIKKYDNTDESTVQLQFFYDENDNGIQDVGEGNYSVMNTTVEVNQTKEPMKYEIESGWNSFSLPYEMEDYKASNLISDLIAQGCYSTKVSSYEDGKWLSYQIRGEEVYSTGDFDIEPSRGYFIQAAQSCDAYFAGRELTESKNIDINWGWNLVGLHPYYSGNTKRWSHNQIGDDLDSKEFLEIINSDSIVTDTISDWYYGSYRNNVLDDGDYYGFPYDIDDRKGYFIKVKDKTVDNWKL